MEWRGRRGSRNIEDRRRMSGGARAGGVGIVGMLAILAVGYFFGVDITPVVEMVDGGSGASTSGQPLSDQDQAEGEFVSVVLADTDEVWQSVFAEQVGQQYPLPTLVLFKGVTPTACGTGQAAMGPFYCPGDRKVYLDTAFFTTLSRKLGAQGDFAAAYVVAHEVGHHVQNSLGILSEVNKLRSQVSQRESNALSVLTELQADCFAGIWARHAAERFGSIDQGDIQEAIEAARAVGDDILQQSAGQVPVPDSFTHGSAEQRQTWFIRGFDSGELQQCNTFSEAGL